MSMQLSSVRRHAVACGLLLGLSGCVAAVPLAQMAVTQMAPPPAPCAAPSGCQTGGFGDISKGISSSFGKLMGGSAQDQRVAADVSKK
jgi:hypothetical protein